MKLSQKIIFYIKLKSYFAKLFIFYKKNTKFALILLFKQLNK